MFYDFSLKTIAVPNNFDALRQKDAPVLMGTNCIFFILNVDSFNLISMIIAMRYDKKKSPPSSGKKETDRENNSMTREEKAPSTSLLKALEAVHTMITPKNPLGNNPSDKYGNENS